MSYTGQKEPLRKQGWLVIDAPLIDGRRLVEEHHYAKGGSNTCVYMHGLYEANSFDLHGVAWWLPPTRVACESVNRDDWKRVLSLTRLVITPDTPANAASFLLAKSVKLIKSDGRFSSLVTYADDSQGHLGTIYRAAGWDYVGVTAPSPRWIDPKSGRQVSPKATKNRTKEMMLALGYVKVGSFVKHKFIKHLFNKA